MTSTAPPPACGFSRPFDLTDLHGAGSATRTIEASADECRRLADRFALQAVDRLHAHVSIAPASAGEIVVTCRLGAHVVQTCVVTLEPVPADIDDLLELRFAPGAPEPGADLVIVGAANDPAEPLAGDTLDLGEIAAQQLALALDPIRARQTPRWTPPALTVMVPRAGRSPRWPGCAMAGRLATTASSDQLAPQPIIV